ncbi:MAG TPA: ABC transporter ATP-binding protein [Acidimicrobiales bacterium]|nr:ABC transporter ATP-binding protein [Acidimicrobiales bacterium]
MIRLDHVAKQYPNGRFALRDLSLEMKEGELTVLVGPSGCGKTTTLKLINRLIAPTGGRIYLDGEDISRVDPVLLRRRIGYVIQQVGLFPHLTIGANIATVPRLVGWDKRRVRARVEELLALVGLEPAGYRDRYPHELSGGQQQRVGVARALGADPPVLLMDEPFGALDPVTRARLQDELLMIQAGVRKTIVFVTHDVDEAVKLGDRIAILHLEGVLAQHATPAEILAEPASDFVAEFVGDDRGLKLLSVTRIPRRALVSASLEDLRADRPRVPESASMKDALAQMVLADTDRIAVMDRAGTVIGTLTLHAVATWHGH